MKIIKFDIHKDGGTIEITIDQGIYCFDKRQLSTTKGLMYEGYPKNDNSNAVGYFIELRKEIIKAIKETGNEFYINQIDNLINSCKKRKVIFEGGQKELIRLAVDSAFASNCAAYERYEEKSDEEKLSDAQEMINDFETESDERWDASENFLKYYDFKYTVEKLN